MKNNMVKNSQLAGGKPAGYLQAQTKDLITRDCRETNP